MQKSYELLIFDWDGTLMDSAARIVRCMRAAIADLGLAAPGDEQIRNIIGLGLKEAIRQLLPAADEQLMQSVIGRYRHHFLFADNTPTPLFAGARELLQALRAEGYLLAVATGKGRPGLDRVLCSTGLGALFHTTRCADEAFSKPHPDMLLQILDELGVRAADALMIGDTEYDLQMANSAGAAALAVSYGVHSAERLLRHEPVACLGAISEISPWLSDNSRRARGSTFSGDETTS